MMVFRHIGGNVVNQARAVVPLADVEPLIRHLHKHARLRVLLGFRQDARVLALGAWTLYEAAKACEAWRAAAGWRDPKGAIDKPRR